MYERIRRIKEALGVADDTDYKKPTSGGRAEDHPPHLRTGQVYHGLLIPDANQADGGESCSSRQGHWAAGLGRFLA